MRFRVLVTLFGLAGALAGCQTNADTPENKAKLAQLPGNYRELALAYFKATLKDPYSVRDAQITEPTVIFVGLVNGTTAPGVCVQLNAKNSFGAYTGSERLAVAYRNGKIVGVAPPVFDTCSNSTWHPFPELNGA